MSIKWSQFSENRGMTMPQEKGFAPILFDCVDKALASTIGREAVASFYYGIQEGHGLPEKEFSQKPLELLDHLKEIVGEAGFRFIEKPIITQIRETFQISQRSVDLIQTVDLAKRNYLRHSAP